MKVRKFTIIFGAICDNLQLKMIAEAAPITPKGVEEGNLYEFRGFFHHHGVARSSHDTTWDLAEWRKFSISFFCPIIAKLTEEWGVDWFILIECHCLCWEFEVFDWLYEKLSYGLKNGKNFLALFFSALPTWVTTAVKLTWVWFFFHRVEVTLYVRCKLLG